MRNTDICLISGVGDRSKINKIPRLPYDRMYFENYQVFRKRPWSVIHRYLYLRRKTTASSPKNIPKNKFITKGPLLIWAGFWLFCANSLPWSRCSSVCAVCRHKHIDDKNVSINASTVFFFHLFGSTTQQIYGLLEQYTNRKQCVAQCLDGIILAFSFDTYTHIRRVYST